jgi:hypothetical protein
VKNRDALPVAARLEQMGVVVRSVELSEEARLHREFAERGGNRAMRRAKARAK